MDQNARQHIETRKESPSGFSLVEMAIVLVILALLLGGGLTVLNAQVEQQKYKDSQRLLEEFREALIGFAIREGRLPCPADPALASGTAGAGQERTAIATGCTGGAAALQGAVPWATLGLSELDGWNRRFTYRVSATFARSVPQTTNFNCTVAPTTAPAQAAFALCSNGDITIRNAAAGAVLASNIPAIIVSHGPNGLGAFLPGGTAMPASTDADETENADANTNFISKTPTATFDDVLIWVAPTTLSNRMLQAGRLP